MPDLILSLDLEDGRTVQVLLLTYGRARLGIGARGSLAYDDVYWYDDPEEAVAAAMMMVLYPNEEPTGWSRHPTTGRRRPDGDETREHVAP